MNYVTWLYRRLSVMGPKEVLFRCGRMLGEIVERHRIERGWLPSSECEVKSAASLFPSADTFAHHWFSHYKLDKHNLDKLLAGEVNLFGHYDLKCGLTPQWHTEPISGNQLPKGYAKKLNYRDESVFGNVKAIWELGRQHHLIPLAVAYAVTGEEKYLKPVVAHIDSWLEQNPFLQGIHWCFSLEASLRLITWSIIHSLIISRRGGEGLFDIVASKKLLSDSLYQHAWFVRHFLSRYSSANNHLIGELTGLWVACQVFDFGEQGKIWANEAKIELENEFQKQNFSDGVNKEQATYYHLWVLEYGLLLKLVGQRMGAPFSEAFQKRVAKMAYFLRAITPEKGLVPQIGDADDGFVSRFDARWPEHVYEDVLAAEAYTQGCWTFDQLPQKAFWYGLITDVAESKQQPSNEKSSSKNYPIFFPEAGYAVLGSKRLHVIFDAGSLGYPEIAAHGHADMLSFCLALDGQWLIVDPGTYCYHDKIEWRDYFRSTVAHNTINVDQKNQSIIGGPFLWLKHAKAQMESGDNSLGEQVQHVCGQHDGYTGLGVTHQRSLALDKEKDSLVIDDVITGELNRLIEINFHFAPDLTVDYDKATHSCLVSKGDKLALVLEFSTNDWQFTTYTGSESPRKGWYSEFLGKKEPATTLCGVYQGSQHTDQIILKTKIYPGG